MALYAFDGTWNDSRAPDDQRDARKDTNVHRFRVLYSGEVEYVDGVGSRGGQITRIFEGITGAGAQKRLEEHFSALKRRFKNGDTVIDIVGYSRGAAIARMFVSRIERDFESIEFENKPLTEPPTVRFLGLFDTVASFGIPWNANEGDFLPDIPEFVEHTYHAMALDETRETFGIERCFGNRTKITEVWFRGSHGDIGGNATYADRKKVEVSNLQRSDLALTWMLAKATACGLPFKERTEERMEQRSVEPPVTVRSEIVSIGKVGTLSRRIHLGDLVHHTLERSELTRGIDGIFLRRIDVPTRIEDEQLESQSAVQFWIPPEPHLRELDNARVESAKPSLVELSSRRYPFDVLPARTWQSWFRRWKIESGDFDQDRMVEFWAPCAADRALAWDMYVELQTRITTQVLEDEDGNDLAALESVYKCFPLSRDFMHKHGVDCVNTATLLTYFLNQKVRSFTAKWHKRSVDEIWKGTPTAKQPEFRTELKTLQPTLRLLATALSQLADARL